LLFVKYPRARKKLQCAIQSVAYWTDVNQLRMSPTKFTPLSG